MSWGDNKLKTLVQCDKCDHLFLTEKTDSTQCKCGNHVDVQKCAVFKFEKTGLSSVQKSKLEKNLAKLKKMRETSKQTINELTELIENIESVLGIKK